MTYGSPGPNKLDDRPMRGISSPMNRQYASVGKSKTPAIRDSLNSLLQTLHVQKKRLETGLATETELTLLARTVEARKKETDETLEGKL